MQDSQLVYANAQLDIQVLNRKKILYTVSIYRLIYQSINKQMIMLFIVIQEDPIFEYQLRYGFHFLIINLFVISLTNKFKLCCINNISSTNSSKNINTDYTFLQPNKKIIKRYINSCHPTC